MLYLKLRRENPFILNYLNFGAFLWKYCMVIIDYMID